MPKKAILILLLAAAVLLPVRVRAMDPVTMAVFAPLALKAASIAMPYVMRGMQSGAVHMVKIGYDMVAIFRLPLGLGQTLLGWPFGYFEKGIKNTTIGAVAPLKMTWDIVLLPVALTGVSTGGNY
ncbi:MAG: hypothetical protein IJS01_09520 [Lentisphaeria bacterium]|nr:hypothetical protein [Lentisphaeria bacterium]